MISCPNFRRQLGAIRSGPPAQPMHLFETIRARRDRNVNVVFRFARDSLLEEAGFELSVPQKTSSVPGRLRFPFAADYFSLPGNQEEATSGVLRTLVVPRGTESSKPASGKARGHDGPRGMSLSS